VIEDAAEAKAEGRSRSVSVDHNGGRVCFFLEVIRPPLRLVLFGSGPDAEPVARMARELGWSITAIDRRAGRLSRIAAADRTLAGPIAAVAQQIGLDRSCRVVVMTHDFGDDGDAIRAALASEAPYIGVLGPRRRTEALLDRLADDGMRITDAMTERIHAPIGLDLGADAPEEIALAIVAEIQAAGAGRSGGRLRDRPGTIHDRRDAISGEPGGAILAACVASGP
jgi:xanthine/CO dehydrogenase XdhC/CoxF family maturation factor